MADTVPLSLMELPYEIRQNVLEQYFQDQTVVVMPQCKGKPYAYPKCDTRLPPQYIAKPHSCIGVFLVCRQLTEEARPIFYKETRFDLMHFLEHHSCASMKSFAHMQSFYGTTDLLHFFNLPGFAYKSTNLRLNENPRVRELHVVLGETFWRKGERSCLSVMRSLKSLVHSDNNFDLSIEIVLPQWKKDSLSVGVTVKSKTRKRTYWPEDKRPLLDCWPWRRFLQRLDLAPGDAHDIDSDGEGR